MAGFPCLIFSDDGKLCEAKGIPKKYPQLSDLQWLGNAFHKSLRGDLRDFLLFCSAPWNPDSPGFRILTLHDFPVFRYAFCEKDVLHGSELNFVFLSDDMTEFFRFLTPSSFYFRELSAQLVGEVLRIKSSRYFDYSQLTPEAFLLTTHVPHLTETLFPVRCGACYCDLIELTKIVLEQMRSRPPYRNLTLEPAVRYHGEKLEQHLAEADSAAPVAEILEFSTPAYGCLLYCLLHILHTVGQNGTLALDFYPSPENSRQTAAEVTLTAETFRFSRNPGMDESLNALRYLPPECGSLAQIAAVICELADIRQSLSYDPVSGLLSITLGLGFEHQFKPDYKYSDPCLAILPVLEDTERLLALLSGEER